MSKVGATQEITDFLTRQSPEDLDALLPVLVLSKGIEYEKSPALSQMMNRFFAAAGATPDMDRDEATARIEAHVKTVPLDTTMMQRLSEMLQGVSAEEQRKIGEEASARLGQTKATLSNEPPPEGAVSAKEFVRPPGDKIR